MHFVDWNPNDGKKLTTIQCSILWWWQTFVCVSQYVVYFIIVSVCVAAKAGITMPTITWNNVSYLKRDFFNLISLFEWFNTLILTKLHKYLTSLSHGLFYESHRIFIFGCKPSIWMMYLCRWLNVGNSKFYWHLHRNVNIQVKKYSSILNAWSTYLASVLIFLCDTLLYGANLIEYKCGIYFYITSMQSQLSNKSNQYGFWNEIPYFKYGFSLDDLNWEIRLVPFFSDVCVIWWYNKWNLKSN